MIDDRQIETLAEGWPWPNADVAEALRLAEQEGWPLDDTVRALDALAEDFGTDGKPVDVIRAAIAYNRSRNRSRKR